MLKFSGDMRYRHEAINDDASAERQRQRIRARFGVTADVTDDVRVGLTLATGNDDPVSANQTLDTGFSRKSIGVDRAYFAWDATDDLNITGGKMADPFFRPGNHHLIYDGDLNPEGLALRYNRTNWFASFAGLWVEERGAADDSILLGGQLAYRRALDGGKRLTAGVSYYDYLNTQNQTPFWDGAPAGNRVDAAGNYLNDFNEAELFAEFNFKAGERPLSLFADYVTNVEADDENTGYALGACVRRGDETRHLADRLCLSTARGGRRDRHVHGFGLCRRRHRRARAHRRLQLRVPHALDARFQVFHQRARHGRGRTSATTTGSRRTCSSRIDGHLRRAVRARGAPRDQPARRSAGAASALKRRAQLQQSSADIGRANRYP